MSQEKVYIKLDPLPSPEECESFNLPHVDYWNRFHAFIAEYLRFMFHDTNISIPLPEALSTPHPDDTFTPGMIETRHMVMANLTMIGEKGGWKVTFAKDRQGSPLVVTFSRPVM